jgi:hypothetical protein
MIDSRNIDTLFYLNRLFIKRNLLYFDKFIVLNRKLGKSKIVGVILFLR